MESIPITGEELEEMKEQYNLSVKKGFPWTPSISWGLIGDGHPVVKKYDAARRDLNRCIAEIERLRAESQTEREAAVREAFDRLDLIDFNEGGDTTLTPTIFKWMDRVKAEMFPGSPA